MGVPGTSEGEAASDGETAGSFGRGLLDVVLTGVAIIVPLVVTVYVLWLVLQFIGNALRPFIRLLEWSGLVEALQRVELIVLLVDLGIYSDVIGVLSEIVAVVILAGVVVVVGTIARHRYGERAIEFFDLLVASIPGIGTIYKSFRRMSDIMLDEGVENFQEVKLVEALHDDTYVIGFVTNRSPPAVQEALDEEEMLTMFLPLAPNPVTGGFLAHVPADRTVDVDLSIEDGIRSIITSGIARADDDRESMQLTMDDIQEFADIGDVDVPFGGAAADADADAETDGDATAGETGTD